MNNLMEFKKQVNTGISKAKDLQRINLGLRICRDLLPDYEQFERNNHWGKSAILLSAIKFIEENKFSTEVNKELINEMIDKVEKIIPDTEAFSGWSVSFALNAASSVSELLSYLKDRDYSHIIDISAFMIDNIDFKIQMNNENITETEIDNHPDLLCEFKNQLAALE